jgi:hypothetical protein
MLREVTILGIGLLVLVTGCAFKLGNLAQVNVKVTEQVDNDSIDRVAERLENEMRRLGLQVAVTPGADVVRVTSTTKSGQRFIVVLSRVKGQQGKRTTVHIDWEQVSDNNLWLQLLLVAGQTAAASK